VKTAEEGKETSISEDVALHIWGNNLKHHSFQWRCSFTTRCKGSKVKPRQRTFWPS